MWSFSFNSFRTPRSAQSLLRDSTTEMCGSRRLLLTSMKKSPLSPLLPLFSSFLFFTPLFSPSSAADQVDRAGSVKDGDTLVSAGGAFELGFFVIGGSSKKYLCIRFNKGQEKPIVWVANRERPLNDSSGVLKFSGDGELIVVDGGGDVVWSTGMPPDGASNRVAQLLDSGNLVIRDAGDVAATGGFLWQSFDEIGNSLLPGMKLLVNTRTGASRRLGSWKSVDDPSPGAYSYGLEVDELPRLVLRQGSTITMSTGHWNGVRFSGTPSFNANTVFNTSVVSSGDEVYYTDSMIDKSSLLRVRLDPSGTLYRLVWDEDTQQWSTLWTAPATCEWFDTCGPFSACSDAVFPFCRCLRGFRPKSQPDWDMGNTINGCVRSTTLRCGGGGASFLPVGQVRLPELENATVNMGMSLAECHDSCDKDCACTAYATADIRQGGSGCIKWSGGLLNVRNFSHTNSGQTFYLKVSPSDLDTEASGSHKRKRKTPAIVVSVSVVSGLFLILSCFWINKKKKTKKKGTTVTGRSNRQNDETHVDGEDTDLPLFDFETITSATKDFSFGNKIGEGGFGIVYKGTLNDGQDIAVKRLSWKSAHGLSEFMNEVKLILKLQHKNLVRLLGCCIQGDERMLIYEYMQNKSLDLFIFDDMKRGLLDWEKRLDIILGIARGLLYLHHDSRFKIIHRDLKVANILLDGMLNPKISDFGTARIFDADQVTENTKRVIGTYGYMAPEYAINGIFSVKSDVFSFGVIILEVLSGIKNRGMYATEPHINLLSHAWKLWQEGNGLELLDPMVTGICLEVELLRCIQVGLLCVQELARDRPTMYEVVMMLGSKNFPLPQPKSPGFLVFRSPFASELSSSSQQEPWSANELTSTSILEGR